MVTYGGDLVWCKIGDTAWKGYRDEVDVYGNIAFHNEKLYAVDRCGDKVDIFQLVDDDAQLKFLLHVGTILAKELNTEVMQTTEPEPMDVYLVECGGRLLVVKRYYALFG